MKNIKGFQFYCVWKTVTLKQMNSSLNAWELSDPIDMNKDLLQKKSI